MNRSSSIVMSFTLFLLSAERARCLSPSQVHLFVKDFIRLEESPSDVVSFINFNPDALRRLSKLFSSDGTLFSQATTTPTGLQSTIFLLDLSVEGSVQILRKAERLGLLKTPHSWIVFQDSLRLADGARRRAGAGAALAGVEAALAGVDIRVYSQVLVAVVDGETVRADMVYRIRPHLELVWEPYGVWSAAHFADQRASRVPALRRQNLRGVTVTDCSVHTDNDTVNHLDDFVDKHIDPMTKAAHPFSMHLLEFMNATPRVVVVSSWGYRRPDGTYDGVINEVMTGNADFAGSPLIFTKERMEFLEFIGVNTPMKAAFIFRKPPLSTVANLFLLPFGSDVWLASVLLLLFVTGCTFVAWMWEDGKMKITHQTHPKRVSDSVLDTISVVFQQGVWKEPQLNSGRAVLLTSLISFMFLFTAYSAYVVALLQSSTDDINSLADLLASPLELGVQNVSYNRYFFKTENDPVRRAIWEKKLLPRGENKVFIPTEEGVRRMRRGLYAFHGERISVYDMAQKTFLEEEKCQFQEIEFLPITYPYIAIKADSPFKEILKIGAKRLLECGLQSRTIARVMTAKPTCAGGGGGNFVSVTIRDCAPALQCLLVGYAVACGLCVLENVAARRNRSREQKTTDITIIEDVEEHLSQ